MIVQPFDSGTGGDIGRIGAGKGAEPDSWVQSTRGIRRAICSRHSAPPSALANTSIGQPEAATLKPRASMTISHGVRNGAGDGSTPPAQEQTLVHLCQISALSWLANRSEIVQNTWYGEPGYTYAGFPTDDGNIGNAYRILTSLGVSPQCRDLSGARAFLQYCFSYLQEESLRQIMSYCNLK